MADCKYCGAQGLTWVRCDSGSGWDLMEPDGEFHDASTYCSVDRRSKYRERLKQEEDKQAELIRKYKQDSGYLS